MADFVMLLALAGAMFVGSYMSGMVPLSVPLTEARLHLVSVFGAGLLVGTALSVIIPEGISTLYLTEIRELVHDVGAHGGQKPGDATLTAASGVSHSHLHDDLHGKLEAMDPRNLVGITLVLGFLFMLLVDQLISQHRHHKALAMAVSDPESTNSVHTQGRSFTATLGLVVHAAADGVALGAAATTSNLDTEAVVFLAIMLHKAPAAFALVSFLMHEAVERPTIRKHLLIFSLAAPLLAIITFLAINRGAPQSIASQNATGVALLFSAGTFLYVATVHVLPELVVRHSTHQADNRGRMNTPPNEGFTRTDVLAIVVGTLLPMILTVGHHGH
ncbi:zinc/iron regulated transporter-related protein 102B [Dermacentor variabilis]|uniref:zinc/iron regulated transporter-related protein 102B n=1 Tax=Dermacentor variabilis TaxID=34621 RepID=UPI003F5C08DF